MGSLKERVKEDVLEVIRSVHPENGWKVLIVDHTSLRMISACLRMFDIMEEGVTLVEDIKKKRKPLPTFEAIYLISPTLENMEFIKNDFANKRKPLYAAIHVYFIDACDDKVLKQMAHANVKKVVKTVKELTLSFVPLEARVFSLDDVSGFHNAYSTVSNGEDVKNIAAKIAGLCSFLGENPIVRYHSTRDANTELAQCVQSRLDELRTFNPKMAVAGNRRRSQLLIVDRGYDNSSPLVHELTYQAAAYDLLPITNDVYHHVYEDGSGRKKERDVVLNEQDSLWVEFRHHHMANVFKEISDKSDAFVKEKQGLTDVDTSGAHGIKKLRETMKAIPQYQEQVKQFSLHLEMATDINQHFSKELEELTMVEQDIVTSKDKDGKKISNYIELISEVIVSKKIMAKDKIRALMLCAVAMNGFTKQQFNDLLTFSEVPEHLHDALKNLEMLGQKVVVDKVKKKKKSKRKDVPDAFVISRWVPLIKDAMQDAIKGKLDLGQFPCIRGAESLNIGGEDDDDEEEVHSARKRGNWAQKNGSKGKQKNKVVDPRTKKPCLIVYYIGAVSYNEMRAAYEVSNEHPDWDVYIGSQQVMNPDSFVSNVASLSKRLPKAAPAPSAAETTETERPIAFVPGKTTAEALV